MRPYLVPILTILGLLCLQRRTAAGSAVKSDIAGVSMPSELMTESKALARKKRFTITNPQELGINHVAEQVLDYGLNFVVQKSKALLSRTIILGLLNIIILPIIKVIFIKTGLFKKGLMLLGRHDPEREAVIHAPGSDSDVTDVLAWQVYHAIQTVGSLNSDNFVYS